MKQPYNQLTINNLSFAFNQLSNPFFDNLSFSCAPSSITFLQGKNGVGKSTLFRLIQGHINENEWMQGTFNVGTEQFVAINNYVSNTYTSKVKHVLQNVDAMMALSCTVQHNLQLAKLSRYPAFAALPPIEQVGDLLANKGINFQELAVTLSGGQRQLLAIAMVLQTPTAVLLLDEPTAALDDRNAHLVMETIYQCAQERNLVVIIITHDAELVAHYDHFGKLVLKEEQGKRIIERIR